MTDEPEVLYPDVLETPEGRLLLLERGEVTGELVYDVSPVGKRIGDDLDGALRRHVLEEDRFVDLGELRRRLGL